MSINVYVEGLNIKAYSDLQLSWDCTNMAKSSLTIESDIEPKQFQFVGISFHDSSDTQIWVEGFIIQSVQIILPLNESNPIKYKLQLNSVESALSWYSPQINLEKKNTQEITRTLVQMLNVTPHSFFKDSILSTYLTFSRNVVYRIFRNGSLSFKELFDKLASDVQCHWFITKQETTSEIRPRNVCFLPILSDPVNIDLNTNQFFALSYKKNNSRYANIVNLISDIVGDEVNGEWARTQTGSGQITAWIDGGEQMPYPLQKLISFTITTTSTTFNLTCGIKTNDPAEDSVIGVFYQEGSRTLEFNSLKLPSLANIVKVNWVANYIVKSRLQYTNDSEIQRIGENNKLVGNMEKTIHTNEPITIEEAENYAKQLLDYYANENRTVSVSSTSDFAGSLQVGKAYRLSVDNYQRIFTLKSKKASIYSLADNALQYDLNFVEGDPFLTGAEPIIPPKEFQVGETEIVIFNIEMGERLALGEEYEAGYYLVLYCDNTPELVGIMEDYY